MKFYVEITREGKNLLADQVFIGEIANVEKFHEVVKNKVTKHDDFYIIDGYDEASELVSDYIERHHNGWIPGSSLLTLLELDYIEDLSDIMDEIVDSEVYDEINSEYFFDIDSILKSFDQIELAELLEKSFKYGKHLNLSDPVFYFNGYGHLQSCQEVPYIDYMDDIIREFIGIVLD